METPLLNRRRVGARARLSLAVVALIAATAAVSLYLHSTPVLTLRLAPGWHVLSTSAHHDAHGGELMLAGPGGARFDLYWDPKGFGWGCAEDCGAAPELKPVAATLAGHSVTLFPYGWFPGDNGHSLPLHSLVLNGAEAERG